jgi:hypothetical protein
MDPLLVPQVQPTIQTDKTTTKKPKNSPTSQPSKNEQLDLPSLAVGVRRTKVSDIPPNRKVPMESIVKTTGRGNYGEPPGIDYGKLFSRIGRFFRAVAKCAEEGASSARDFIRNPTILSKQDVPQDIENEGVVKIKEVKFSADLKNPKSKSLQVATSNVGPDGAYGQLNKLLSQNIDKPTYVTDYVNNMFDQLAIFLEVLPPNPESKELTTFLSDLGKLTGDPNRNIELTENQKKQLTSLVGFLTNLENRKQLQAHHAKNKPILKDSDFNNQKIFALTPKGLDQMNEAVFALYHFSNIHSEWTKKQDGSTLNDYITKQTLALEQERVDQIKDKDVCFLQELSPNSHFIEKTKERTDISLFVPKGVLGMSFPSLMINKNRFTIEKFTKENTEKSNKNNDYVETRIQIPGVNIKQTLQIYDDGSFGSGEKFRAVIAFDTKNNNRKMLLCSVHVRGYGIGINDDFYQEAYKDVGIMQKMIEKIAADHGVEGIIMGGDFNSVEERVGAIESPLIHLKEANYVPVKVKSDTEVAPSGFYQGGYDLSRRIDHLFVKWLPQDGKVVSASKGKVADGRKGSLDPLKQTVFDHEALSAEIEIKKSWLKMLQHRFHHLRSEPNTINTDQNVI